LIFGTGTGISTGDIIISGTVIGTGVGIVIGIVT
jgi:hypothetical protein